MEGGGKHPPPPQCYNETKKPSAYRVKPMNTGSPVTVSSDGTEPTRFDSMSKASASTGIPYSTLLYAKKNSKSRIHFNGKEYVIKFITS